MLRRGLNLVLIHPNIPGNTGCIGRTAVATGSRLHLIHPLGFSLDEKAVKRAGLDYWPQLDLTEHDSWEAFLRSESEAAGGRPPRAWLFTTHARTSGRPHWNASMRAGDYLLFGSETAGAPDAVHSWVQSTWGEEHRVCLPMVPEARSINLSTAVGAAVFEATRQVAAAEALEASFRRLGVDMNS
jgi:tRNA (cytidine/uridine-2'-O-)-methyltransferase